MLFQLYGTGQNLISNQGIFHKKGHALIFSNSLSIDTHIGDGEGKYIIFLHCFSYRTSIHTKLFPAMEPAISILSKISFYLLVFLTLVSRRRLYPCHSK